MHPVFRTYEILEQILTCLDHVSLRHARLVDSFWHTVIAQNSLLCLRYRQCLRLRVLRLLVLGVGDIGKRSLVRKCCYSSQSEQKSWDPGFSHAYVNLPETDGETWMAQMEIYHGEAELAVVRGKPGGLQPLSAWVLVYQVGSRNCFEEITRWWKEGRLNPGLRDAGKRRSGTPNAIGPADSDNEGTSQLRALLSALMKYVQMSKPKLDQPPLRGTTTAHASPILLALVGTKDLDLEEESRAVDASEGEALANEMGVPFFEISFRSDRVQADLGSLLQSFWRTYRAAWMKTRAEQQRREKKSSDAVTVALDLVRKLRCEIHGKVSW